MPSLLPPPSVSVCVCLLEYMGEIWCAGVRNKAAVNPNQLGFSSNSPKSYQIVDSATQLVGHALAYYMFYSCLFQLSNSCFLQ